ncbi:MAG: AsmA-like C-terminal region-containing protein, partial [Burkholderiaceae bacterium]
NLRIVGVQASVFIDSQADLLAETQNTRVLVLPELNAGLASLGYALVNPAIGLGSFLAQYVLRDPLRKILAYEYQLTGSWADPQVKELSRTEAAEKAQRETQQGR